MASSQTPTTKFDTYYGAPFDDDDADIILRSSSGVDFRVYKSILAKSSPFFKDMFSMPQPKPDPTTPNPTSGKDASAKSAGDEAPVVPVSEDTSTLAHLLTFCYPLEEPTLTSLESTGAVLAAAKKYEMDRAYNAAGRVFASSALLGAHPAKAYGIACGHRLEREARVAARACLAASMNLEALGEQLEHVEGRALHRLWRYHRRCADEAAALARPQNYAWITRRNGEVWQWANPGGCQCGRTPCVVANGETWQAKAWWKGYMERAEGALKIVPAGKTVVAEDLLTPAFDQAAACNTCRTAAIRCMLTFSQVFEAEIERRLEQVELEMPF
ncbi:hypothetical protein OF83DRAFT_1114161 [Amylostereum chailletii]|nr:hypothetical protein OF83DRAFT_1114161 [Amylostereum chailletii]